MIYYHAGDYIHAPDGSTYIYVGRARGWRRVRPNFFRWLGDKFVKKEPPHHYHQMQEGEHVTVLCDRSVWAFRNNQLKR